jgi:carbon monoxide dehydrogenase subunit G
MRLEHTFEVPASLDLVWDLLADLDRVAPCLPGAEVTGRAGDVWLARTAVRLGPMKLVYAGEITIAERDEADRRTKMRATGTEGGGRGTAAATITTTLHERGPKLTEVASVTELELTGRVAQMGRGIVEDVSEAMMGEFAANLADQVVAAAPVSASTNPRVNGQLPEPSPSEAAAETGPPRTASLRRRRSGGLVGMMVIVLRARWRRLRQRIR